MPYEHSFAISSETHHDSNSNIDVETGVKKRIHYVCGRDNLPRSCGVLVSMRASDI